MASSCNASQAAKIPNGTIYAENMTIVPIASQHHKAFAGPFVLLMLQKFEGNADNHQGFRIASEIFILYRVRFDVCDLNRIPHHGIARFLPLRDCQTSFLRNAILMHLPLAVLQADALAYKSCNDKFRWWHWLNEGCY